MTSLNKKILGTSMAIVLLLVFSIPKIVRKPNISTFFLRIKDQNNLTFLISLIEKGSIGMAFCSLAVANELLKDIPFRQGEKITFDIKKFGITVGTATLVFNGLQNLNGQSVYLITFTSRSLNFFDEERIYVDPETFYPLMVKRDLNIFGSKEKIVENYLKDQGIVKIAKTVKGRTIHREIKKKEHIDNIYCFLYRYRLMGPPQIGDSFMMHLPTKDVKISLVKLMNLKIGGKIYRSHFWASQPKQYSVWFDTGDSKIPLRIDGSAGIVSSSLVFKDYQQSGSPKL